MWNDILLEFGDDETIIFGPRVEQFEGKSVYQSRTVATISCEEKVETCPFVTGAATADYIAFSIDSRVIILGNECKSVLFTLPLESQVNSLIVNENYPFLLVGEQSGFIHLFHINSQLKLLSVPIASDTSANNTTTFKSMCFSSEDENGNCLIVILCNTNHLFLFSQFHVKKLHEAAEHEDLESMQKILAEIEKKEIDLSVLSCDFNARYVFSLFNLSSEFNFGFCGEGDVALGVMTHDERMQLLQKDCFEGEIRKAQATQNGKYIIVLDDTMHLYVVCSVTLMVISVCNIADVMDFFLLDYADYERSDAKVATLTSSNFTYWFHLWSFPYFEPLYSLRVSEFATLIPTSSQAHIFVVDGLKKNDSDEFVSTIRIRKIEDVSPERRLLQLIYKRKFEEAESFAKLFSLDVEEVHKAKVAFYFNLISPWRVEKLDENIDDIIVELKSSLQLISDKRYIVSCCLQASLPSLKLTKELLLFAKDYCSGIKDDEKDALLVEVNSLLRRLATFQMLYEESDWSSWFEFCQRNIVDEFLLLMNSNKISEAFCLWERHQDEISYQLSDTTIEKILCSIPENLPNEYLRNFLENCFLPNIFQKSSDYMETVSKWLLERVQLMEITEKAHWPQNGISLLEMLTSSCERLLQLYCKGGLGISSKLYTFALQRKVIYSGAYMNKLLHMIDDLKSLALLRNQFGCHLTLSEFSLEDKAAVIFLILDRITSKEKMKKAMNEFLCNYMEENMLTEQIFVKYIKDVIVFSCCGWWYWEEAPWEEKVLSVIGCMCDMDCKLDSTVFVLSQAPVPWSSDIEKLFEEAYMLFHKRRGELDGEKRRMKLKMILIKYDLKSYNIADIKQGQKLVNYILRLNKQKAMEDALVVVNAYPHLSDLDAYLFHMRFLLEKNQEDEFANLVNTMPQEKVLVCGKRFLYLVTELLEAYNTKSDEETNLYMAHLKAGAIYLLRYLQRMDIQNADSFAEDLLFLQRSLSLQMEFDIFVPLSVLRSAASCYEILLKEISNLFSEQKYFENTIVGDFKQQKQMKTFGSIYRLGELLGFQRGKILAELALAAIGNSQVDVAIGLIRNIPDDCSFDYSEAAFSLVHYLLKSMQNFGMIDDKFSELPSIIHQLLSHSLAYCKPNLLQKCLDYCHWTSFLSHMQSMTPKPYFRLSGLKMDHYHQWKFSPFFCDRGLQVPLSQALPILEKCLSVHISYKVQGYNDTYPFDDKNDGMMEFFESGKSLAKILRNKSQEDAALRFVVKFMVAYLDICTSGDPSKKINTDALGVKYWIPDVSGIATSLLHRILASAPVDLTSALGVICTLDVKETMSILKQLESKSENDFKVLTALSSLAMVYTHLKSLGSSFAHYEDIHTKSLWGLRLQEHNVSFQDILSPLPRQEKYHLLDKLIQKTNVTVETIQEYCYAFNIDVDDAFANYLKAMLTRPEIMQSLCEITDAFTLSKNMNGIFSKAEKVISIMSDSTYVAKKLIYLADKIDFYCYEVLLFLKSNDIVLQYCSEDLKNTIERDIEVIKFLETYNRISMPSEYERSCWLSCHPQGDTLPSISSKRLPFHPLIRREQVWKIIDNELSVTTISMWLTISSSLKISSDDLLLLTVQKTISAWVKDHYDPLHSFAWNSNALNSKLFIAIQELISQIANTDKAVAWVTWTLNNVPPGPVKLLIVRHGIHLAEKCAENYDGAHNLRDTIQKLRVVYHKLATEDILHCHGLGMPKYLSLSNSPAKLIISIWEDIGETSAFIYNSKSVYQACKEIAVLNSCELTELYMSLMKKCLPPYSMPSQDETVTFNFNRDFSKIDVEDQVNLQRMTHLLQHGSLEGNALQLINIAIKEMSVSYGHRSRALCCLFAIIEPNMLPMLSGYSSVELWELLKSLYCLAELENIHLSHTLESFQNSDKLELVESILTFSGYCYKALQLAASLCLEYEIWKKPVWSVILHNMRVVGMYEELKELLKSLGHEASLWDCEEFIDAWKHVLFSPFKNDITSEENEAKFFEVFVMLLRCPCIMNIDLDYLSEEFQKHNLMIPAIAVSLLQAEDKDNRIKEFFKYVPIERVQNEFERFERKGYNMICVTQVYQYLMLKQRQLGSDESL